MRSYKLGARLVAAMIAAIAASPGAAQQPMRAPYNIAWIGEGSQFREPVYLVMCTGPCPADRLMLVPNPDDYADGVLRLLGGPYGRRFDVELERNRLVPGVLPSYALRVVIFDDQGDETGAMWLGARPGCNTPDFADGPLTGDVSADFSPRQPGRPDALPLPVSIDSYIAAVESIRPECRERVRDASPSDNPRG